jgi:hypothetical protein
LSGARPEDSTLFLGLDDLAAPNAEATTLEQRVIANADATCWRLTVSGETDTQWDQCHSADGVLLSVDGVVAAGLMALFQSRLREFGFPEELVLDTTLVLGFEATKVAPPDPSTDFRPSLASPAETP